MVPCGGGGLGWGDEKGGPHHHSGVGGLGGRGGGGGRWCLVGVGEGGMGR